MKKEETVIQIAERLRFKINKTPQQILKEIEEITKNIVQKSDKRNK